MYEILIGNKNDNVIRKMQKSYTARLIFAGCCWYLYDLFGRRAGLHIEVIFLISIMGILLLNLFYIPFRLLGNKKISHKIKFMFVVVADIVALYFFNVTESFSLADIWKNMISGVIISLCITGIIVALLRCSAVHSQRSRFMQRDFDNMDGWEFEKWCAEWLRQNGFDNVIVTPGSGDYGADVLCSKNGETYAVQCKKYSGKVSYRAVEEVVCAMNYYRTDRAMIFTNSELTAQANEAARKLGVIVYDGVVICR